MMFKQTRERLFKTLAIEERDLVQATKQKDGEFERLGWRNLRPSVFANLLYSRKK